VLDLPRADIDIILNQLGFVKHTLNLVFFLLALVEHLYLFLIELDNAKVSMLDFCIAVFKTLEDILEKVSDIDVELSLQQTNAIVRAF
jgi:hypothetical protein